MTLGNRATLALDPELDETARRVTEALRHDRQTASRSLLLAHASDALESAARARASLEQLEERLRIGGAWMPPAVDRQRVDFTRKERVEGYREPAVSSLVQLRLRRQPMEHALHIASPVVVFALAVYFLFSQGWLVPALWIPFAALQLFLCLRRHERRGRITLELDDRTLKAGEVEVAREEVRYVSARGRTLEVGLSGRRARVLLRRVAIDDAMALAAALEAELRLVRRRDTRRADDATRRVAPR